ncbi:bestrophin family protein [Chitinophagaceae bacterium LWZ2-11]
MLLKQNLSLYRVFKLTWRIDILMIGLCACAYVVDTYLMADVHMMPALPTLMGTAIAFFVAFNNNQAYSRWWEARTIWGGIVNDSRSWARNILAYTGEKDSDEISKLCRRMIFRHISFLYALKSNLRKIKDDEYKKYLSKEEILKVQDFANVPNALLDLQAHDLQTLSKQQDIDGFRFLATNDLLKNFCDGMGKSERINNTVFPTTYIYFTRLFIWILIILVTMTLSENIGLWSIFFGWVIGFVFHASHINGMSLMNPFELTPSGIPLNSITRTIEINLLQALGEPNIPLAEAPTRNGEYIL